MLCQQLVALEATKDKIILTYLLQIFPITLPVFLMLLWILEHESEMLNKEMLLSPQCAKVKE